MKKLSILFTVLALSVANVFALSGDMSVTTLPSGQKVIIKEVKDNEIVKIDTWINTGSINETDKNTGLSHFLEHLFFKGTKQNPTGTFDRILDSKGATVNAATSKDFTHYYIELPSKDFDLALKLHSDMLLNPEIPEDELNKERLVVIEEISKTKDSPTNQMFEGMYELLYSPSHHPYMRPVIGKKEVIESVSRDEILDYFKRFYTPDSYTTVIVGNVDKDEALKKVAKYFEQEKRTQEKIQYPKVKPLDKITKKTTTMDINKTHMMIGFLAPKFTDVKDNYALDVLSVILTSGKSSILNQELKEKKELVLSISSGNYSQKDSGLFYIYANINPEKENSIVPEIISEIKKIQQGNFDEKFLAKAKKQIKTDTYYARESISNIADDLGYDFTFSSDINYYDNYLNNIDKVTKKDIVRAAKKYLNTEKYALSIVKPKENKIKPISNEIQNNAADRRPNKIIETHKNTKKCKLSNGLSLITKKKTTNSIVAIDLSIKGSKAIETTPLTSMLMAGTLKSGSKNYTSSEFAEFLDENGIKLSVSSSNDIFSIVVQTTKDNLDKAFFALDEVLNRAIFPEGEIKKIKTRKIQELKSISDSPSSYVFDEFKRLAFKDTIYGQNSTFILDNIEKVTRDDIVDFYSKIINPDNMTIAIVGDIDEEDVIDKLNKIIKKNPQGKIFEYKNQNFIPYRPKQNIEKTLSKKEVQANWMALGYKIPGVLNRKDIATLSVINSILGEGMSSRLFVELREKRGLAYAVGSSLSTNVLDSAFIAYIGTNAKSVDISKKGILDEFEKIKKYGVSEQELKNAKDKIMGKFLLSLETNMDEANLLSWYDILGLNLGAYDEYKKLIQNVSQKDILDIAQKYFSEPYIYTVVIQK